VARGRTKALRLGLTFAASAAIGATILVINFSLQAARLVVHPARNPGFTDAVARYRRTIESDTFGSTTLEELLDNEEALNPADRLLLRERYLF